jgi:hypothetical protein
MVHDNHLAIEGLRQGLILIPDISGYSEFVEQTDIASGRKIVYRLLSAIIQTNMLDLDVSEIEGDAVLFYRYGRPPSVDRILKQFERMLCRFNEVLSYTHPKPVGLSLKMIAHYGPITEFQIGRFRKLYGDTLTIAHRLLKNSIQSHCYVLMTDDLLNAVAPQRSLPSLIDSQLASHLCDASDSLKKVGFSYVNYESKTLLVG